VFVDKNNSPSTQRRFLYPSHTKRGIFISCSNKKVIYDSIIIIYMQVIWEEIRENGRGSNCGYSAVRLVCLYANVIRVVGK
jgi:hypothetical protein